MVSDSRTPISLPALLTTPRSKVSSATTARMKAYQIQAAWPRNSAKKRVSNMYQTLRAYQMD